MKILLIPFAPGLIDSPLDALSLLFGLLMFAGGILLMFHHRRQWRRIERTTASGRVRKFEWHKFRRRTLVAALMAGCGAIATSLSTPTHPIMYASLVTVLVLFLVLILVLAAMDLTSIGLFQISHRDPQRQRAELAELIRLQKLKLAEKAAAQASSQEKNEPPRDPDPDHRR